MEHSDQTAQAPGDPQDPGRGVAVSVLLGMAVSIVYFVALAPLIWVLFLLAFAGNKDATPTLLPIVGSATSLVVALTGVLVGRLAYVRCRLRHLGQLSLRDRAVFRVATACIGWLAGIYVGLFVGWLVQAIGLVDSLRSAANVMAVGPALGAFGGYLLGSRLVRVGARAPLN